MKTRHKPLLILATAVLVMVAGRSAALAGDTPTEPLGGKPPAGSKPSVENLAEQVMYQRAFEAVIWSMPAVAKYGLHRATFEMGAGNNVVLAWSAGAKPLFETLTPNNTTPYVNVDHRPAQGPGGARRPDGDRQGQPLRTGRRQLVHHHRRHRAHRRGQGQGRQDPADASGLQRRGPGRLHRGQESRATSWTSPSVPFPTPNGTPAGCLRARPRAQDLLPLGAAESRSRRSSSTR